MQLIAGVLAFRFLGVIKGCAYLAPDYYLTLGMLAFATFLSSMAHGPIFAMIQTLVPSHMRAISVSLIYLFANLIGMGLGPLAVGMLSDVMWSQSGEESLRYALVLMCPGYLWAKYPSEGVSTHLVAVDERASRGIAIDEALSVAQKSKTAQDVHDGVAR